MTEQNDCVALVTSALHAMRDRHTDGPDRFVSDLETILAGQGVDELRTVIVHVATLAAVLLEGVAHVDGVNPDDLLQKIALQIRNQP